ncbi:hypothetical protein PVAG01_01544 [Phlyctema vagabunda]|uniref:DUF7908 domain-containing protein n=1 Tax=Phlyctema vagabunda TaxID=108571 RepID=A0ABR4PXE7_9HELO
MRPTLLLSLFLSAVQSFSIGEEAKRDVPVICYADQPIVKLYVSTNVVTYPVFINTYISANTIININGGVVININNAPTSLSTTVTATATSTVTSTVTITGTGTGKYGSLASETATPFFLSVEPLLLAKRQVGGLFIGSGGQTTDNCRAATIFTIESGSLFSSGEIVSTGFNVTRKPFAVSPIVGSISTVFEIEGSVLEWNNDFFSNNQASYCLSNGTVEAIFSSGAAPSGCTPVFLNTLPVSSCYTASTTTSTTTLAPTGTATVTATPIPTSFLLQAANAGIDGQYAETFKTNDTFDSLIISFDPFIGNASVFSIDADGHLLGPNGTVGNQDPVDGSDLFYPLYLNPPSDFASNFTLPICSLAATGLLSCSEADGRSTLQYCPDAEIIFLDSSVYENCTAIELYAVDAPLAKRNARRSNKSWMKPLRGPRH